MSSNLSETKLDIILVEDNDDDAALLERHLRRSGLVFLLIHRAQTIDELHAALDRTEDPRVILADYNLPEFSGPAALQALKRRELDIPFIMMSGAVSEETAVASMRAGAHDYVSKQNPARLIPAIHREVKEASVRAQRRAAERALRASEARFHSLVEAMPMGLLISDATGQITYANLAAERLLRAQPGALLNSELTLGRICPTLEDAHRGMCNLTLSKEPCEAVCITVDGTRVETLIGVTFLNPEAPEPERMLATFIADLTMQKKSEQLLRRSEKLAVAGRLAASVSHEINNPLEAITNCLYLVSTEEIPASARTYLELAQQELDRVSQITVQTLRFYRASTKATQTDVQDVIDTVLTLLERRIRDQKITVERDMRMRPTVFAHEGEIRQVVANLVGNAIDAQPEGGRIIIRAAEAKDWAANGAKGVVITIADTGMGMSSETSRRIFEPFFSTKGDTGTGLGLWISSEIAEKYGGKIRVRSRPGAGTVFRFFFRDQARPDAEQQELVRQGDKAAATAAP